jgi:sigma-E factor negative regulatory protein RseA
MREQISELVDGELQDHDAGAVLAALREPGDARDAWRTYHLIGDAMRDTPVLSAGFAARVAERLAAEPVVLAPAAKAAPRAAAPTRGWGWRIAASVAAAGFVGWVAFGPRPATEALAPVAQAPQVPVAVQAEPAHVPPPAAAPDYLLAHQRYSPGISLPGMAPYARTVSVETREVRRP